MDLIGVERVQWEFRSLEQLIDEGKLPQASQLTCVAGFPMLWQLRVKDFDESMPGGKELNADLRELQMRHGSTADHMLLELRFPPSYPQEPLFLRLIRPRMVCQSGLVTAGGSFYLEALTPTGSPAGWQPSYTAEAMLRLVIARMEEGCGGAQGQEDSAAMGAANVATVPGPPLRVDFGSELCSSPMKDYLLVDAEATFQQASATCMVRAGADGECASAGGNNKGMNKGTSNGSAPVLSSSCQGFLQGLLGHAALGGTMRQEDDRIVRPPRHWSCSRLTAAGITEFVELPLRDFCAVGDIRESGVKELMEVGFQREAAISALQRTRGDVMAALLNAAIQENGAGEGVLLEMSEEVKEVQAVLTAFHRSYPGAAQEVVRIERVQNLPLLVEYQRRVQQLLQEGLSDANEHQVWHGTSKDNLEAICQQGFKLACSAAHGSLGRGIYFSPSSSTSHQYSKHKDGSLGRVGSAGRCRPSWEPGCLTMLLCQVALGRAADAARLTVRLSIANVAAGRLPPPQAFNLPPGAHSCVQSSHQYLAVYNDAQAFPAYVIHYKEGRAPPYLHRLQLTPGNT